MNNVEQMSHALKRILIIHTDGNSFNNPSLKCIIDLLLEKGCQIDLRYPKSYALMPPYEGVRFLPFGKVIQRLKLIISARVCSWPLVFLSVFVENFFFYKKYDLIIGVDRQGLIEASALNKITGTPHIFISFEIMFESETSARYKSLERIASMGVAGWLVQDKVRAEQLQNENGLDPNKKILLPLASAGMGCPKATRLRDHLGIPGDKKVAISIGSVSGWSMTNQILKSVVDWPEDWVLIIHERYGRTSENLKGELAALTHLIGRKIFISDAATALVDDMGSILAGVSVGLAFYDPDFKGLYTGQNLKYLGLSSGKIGTYLRYGIPVILNEIGLYASEARLYRFGFVVEYPQQILDNLNHCLDEQFRRNALNYFTNKLDFNIYRGYIWQRLFSVAHQNFHSIPQAGRIG